MAGVGLPFRYGPGSQVDGEGDVRERGAALLLCALVTIAGCSSGSRGVSEDEATRQCRTEIAQSNPTPSGHTRSRSFLHQQRERQARKAYAACMRRFGFTRPE